MPATPITTVILDLDETIIHDHLATEQAFASTAAYAAETASVDPDRFTASVRRHAEAFWVAGPAPEWGHDLGTSATEALRSRFPGDDPRMTALREWGPTFRFETWNRALVENGVEDAPLARDLDERWAMTRLDTNLFLPGAEEALRELGRRFRLAMITNGLIDVQGVKVEKTGIGPLFEAVVISGELGFGKPNPEIYHHTLKQLGIEPAEAVMVGDNIRRDVRGSQAVGITGVWIEPTGAATPPDGIQPDITIASLADLPAVLV
ncbi:MAG: HAD family hydrolase [Thermomicrobiales bacterium]